MTDEPRVPFWKRWFSGVGSSPRSAREDRVRRYIINRMGQGARLQDVLEDEYVLRNSSPSERDRIVADADVLRAAREHMHEQIPTSDDRKP